MISSLVGKTVRQAVIVADCKASDQELRLEFTDGTSCVVGAFQREGYPVEIVVEQA